MLWRVCRGNVYLRQDEVEEALEDHLLCEEAEKKSAFLIFFQVKLDRFRRIYDIWNDLKLANLLELLKEISFSHLFPG